MLHVIVKMIYRKIPVISPGFIHLPKRGFGWQAECILTKTRYFSQCIVCSVVISINAVE